MPNHEKDHLSKQKQTKSKTTSNTKSKSTSKKCDWCKSEIAFDAKICNACNLKQSGAKGVPLPWFQITTVLISTVLVALSVAQFLTTLSKNILSSEAADQAKVALKEIQQRTKDIEEFQTVLMNNTETISFLLYFQDDGKVATFYGDRNAIELDHMGAYRRLFWLTPEIEKNNINSNNVHKYLIDLFEFLIFDWLAENYGINWIRNNKRLGHSFPFGGVSSLSFNWAKPDKENTTVISRNKILELLNGNMIVDNNHDIYNGSISLPKDSKINVKRFNKKHYDKKTGTIVHNQHDRTILITNPHLSIKLFIYNGGGGGLSKEAIEFSKMEKYLDTNRKWNVLKIDTRFEIKFNPNRILSEETAQQQLWIEQMLNSFKWDFDWTNIWADIRSSR